MFEVDGILLLCHNNDNPLHVQGWILSKIADRDDNSAYLR